MSEFREKTDPLLNPHQEIEMTEELRRLEIMVDPKLPPHIASQIQDRGEIRRQLKRLSHNIENQTPRPYEGEVLDKAIKREEELREQWTQGMPTQAEMRRNPAGAVDKHQAWERRNKQAVLEWKNIRRRMRASGIGTGSGFDEANIERYRPAGGSQELNLDNAQIPGKAIHIPPNVEIRNVMSDDEREALNAQIAELQRQIDEVKAESSAKKGMSEEKRAAQAERMRQYHARKRAEKEAAKKPESEPETESEPAAGLGFAPST